jgi:CheY-like chemotaxis protein
MTARIRIPVNGIGRVRYEVSLASSGSQALEKIPADHFDIVLLDLMMPEMSVSKSWPKLSCWIRTAVIVITGYTTLERR